LPVIGRAIWQRALHRPVLAIGPSSVAQALLAHWQTLDNLPASAFEPEVISAVQGPVFVLSGSMSPVTARQIQAATSYERIAIALDVLMNQNSPRHEALLTQVVTSLAAG